MHTTPLKVIAFQVSLLFAVQTSIAANYYVSPSGNDNKAGTLAAPFATITNAYAHAGAGDTIYLRGGTYRQQVTLTGVSGSSNAPITLTAYGQETPIISGLDPLKLSWTKTNNTALTNVAVTNRPAVYMATYVAATNSDFTNPVTRPILQLFYNGQPMLAARWPNCPTNADGSWNFFSSNTWATVNTNGNSYGTVADNDLTNLPSSVVGAQAVLNVSHQYYTWTRQVTNMPTSTSFNYSQDLNGVATNQSFDDNRYYLFGQKQFLDAPGEWYYDGTNKLYFMTPNGTSPTNGVLEIKTRPVGFTADNTCSYLTIQGVSFVGTAFQLGTSYNHRSANIMFSNNTVSNSSYTDYLNVNAGTNGYIQDTLFPAIYADQSGCVNNTFAYGALNALLIEGLSNTIENNTIHDFDYSTSLVYPPLQVNLAWVAAIGLAGNDIVRYNNLYRSGGIQLLVAQGTNDVYLNDISQSFLACYGGNVDTAALYTQNYFAAGTRIHHNWVHDGYSGSYTNNYSGGGIGIRGDNFTCGVTVDHNVTWNLGFSGVVIKNTNNLLASYGTNQCVNNTVYNDSAFNGGTNNAIQMTTNANVANENSNSIVVNNLALTIRGSPGSNLQAASVGLLSSNVTPANQSTLISRLVNATTNTNSTSTWLDFRPATNATTLLAKGATNTLINTNVISAANWPLINTNGSTNGMPDVGAYQRGDSIYAIPGQRFSQASYPIVPDGQTNVPTKIDALMWKPAYGAASHTCYFSASKLDVTLGSGRALKGTYSGEANVCTNLPTPLASGTTYYWRVDATVNGVLVKGTIWSFKAQ